MAGLFMLQMSAGVSVRKSVIVDNPPTVDISVNPTTVSAGRNGNVFDVVAADSTVSDDSGEYKQFHSSESGRMELTEPGTILSQADSAPLKQGLEKPADKRETDEELATRFDLQPGATGVRKSRMKSTEPRTKLSQEDSALLTQLLRRESQKPKEDRTSDEELAARFGLKPRSISDRRSRMGLTEPKTRTILSPEDSALLTRLLWLESEKHAEDRKSDEELAAQFGLKLGAIRVRKSKMGLTEPRTTLSPVNSASLKRLLKQELEKPEYERETAQDLATRFGLKPGAIKSRRRRMKLAELKKELSQADSALSN